MNDQLPFFMQPPYFLPCFAAGWLTLCGLLARIGGWANLAKDFRTHDNQEGERFLFASGRLGNRLFPANYGNCLIVTVNARGIRLAILLPFRFQHPPLFLPWSAMESVTELPLLIIFRRTEIVMRDHWPPIDLRGSAAAAVIKAHATYIKRSQER